MVTNGCDIVGRIYVSSKFNRFVVSFYLLSWYLMKLLVSYNSIVINVCIDLNNIYKLREN